MGKKRKKGFTPQRKRNRLPLFLVVAGAILIAGVIWMRSGNENTENISETDGAPRLVVDQDKVDYGDVKLNTPIETVFTIQNAGDGPLEILGVPQVELVDGC